MSAEKGARDDPERLARAAEESLASGGPTTAAQRGLRDAAITALVGAGWPRREVAERFGLTARQIARIVKAQKAIPTRLDDVPMEIVEDLIRGYTRAVADFELMSFELFERAPAASLRAKIAALETRGKLHQLYVQLGKLPSNLELFRTEEMVKSLLFAMVDRLDEAAATGQPEMLELRDYLAYLVGLGTDDRWAPGVGDDDLLPPDGGSSQL